MFRSVRCFGAFVVCCVFILSHKAVCQAAPRKNDVIDAMIRASRFMMEKASNRGGFVWQYSEDLSEQWGEVPARETQIWVQGSTCEFGEFLLKAYRATGNNKYLDYACRVADALVWGQNPAGGWHYLIDFDMPGIRKYYEEVATRCFGWEEYYHYYGNCTFDDNTTAGATNYLLDVYMATLDPKYRPPLDRALAFILEAQYPLGGWPQRYPLRHEHRKQGLKWSGLSDTRPYFSDSNLTAKKGRFNFPAKKSKPGRICRMSECAFAVSLRAMA